ncbi:fasciclin domain-containing protein [Nostoc sp. FACHB-190]|uniref:fasciclin domain-containing protein n=1 Tax=Nostoc sp. FACHB-190 TaxID=2692838 RepID=UPI001F552DF9|nr:fasciclin domain-containing protein [Nostoc sp. FACHB-190]
MRVTGGLAALLLGTGIVIVQPVATALTPSEIAEIARKITVRIDGANTGSGVIIEQQGNVYTVVTNFHVVQPEGNYTVQTPDGQRYTFNHSQVKRFDGVDLAVFQFTSNTNYRVAQKGNSDKIKLNTNISVAGYPVGIPGVPGRNFTVLPTSLSSYVEQPKNGYALVYTVEAFDGMSGGAILDEQGKLVGIHGRAGTASSGGTATLGIPLKTYISLVPSVKPVATAPAPKPAKSSTTPTIVTVLASRNTSFSNFNRALQAAGLIAILERPSSFTIFAPTDAAFAKIPPDAVRDLLKPENKEVLVKIMAYHIVTGKLLSRDLKSGNLKSIEGGSISVKVDPVTGVKINDASITQADITVSNGVIHGIDNIILPPDL